jgi:hypothetical protein
MHSPRKIKQHSFHRTRSLKRFFHQLFITLTAGASPPCCYMGQRQTLPDSGILANPPIQYSNRYGPQRVFVQTPNLITEKLYRYLSLTRTEFNSLVLYIWPVDRITPNRHGTKEVQETQSYITLAFTIWRKYVCKDELYHFEEENLRKLYRFSCQDQKRMRHYYSVSVTDLGKSS